VRWFGSIRCFNAWVVAAFVLAQLSGLIPGHYEHAGTASGHAVVHAPRLGPDGAHHYALADLGDECCALHAMPFLPAVSGAASPVLSAAHRLVLPQARLVSIRFSPLDPPPKLLPRA
jgi:hypothetical protein